MLDLLNRPGVNVVKRDQCMYGLVTPSQVGACKLATKPTQWVSNSRHMLLRLNKRRGGKYEHQHLEGRRTAKAAIYPRQLIVNILRGMRGTADARVHEPQQEENNPDVVSSVTCCSGLLLRVQCAVRC